jgi:hypothetical protein
MDSTSNLKHMIDDARKSLTDMTPTEHVAHKDEIFCFAASGDKNENTIYSKLTGQFSVRSFDGMKGT